MTKYKFVKLPKNVEVRGSSLVATNLEEYLEEKKDEIRAIHDIPLENEWETNREKKRKPKKGKFWCNCDRAIISEGRKCPFCKKRSGLKRNKKEA